MDSVKIENRAGTADASLRAGGLALSFSLSGARFGDLEGRLCMQCDDRSIAAPVRPGLKPAGAVFAPNGIGK